MNATKESLGQEGLRWVLLIHQLPPKPDYVRVKVRRRLQRLGAVLLKNSVYVLPENDGAVEDLHWLANEIAADGGDSTICSASILSGVSDDELVALFRAARDEDYAEVAAAARAVDPASQDVGVEITRLGARVEAIRRIDYFDSSRRVDAERAIASLRPADVAAAAARPRASGSGQAVKGPSGATWVTRKDVFIDRMASAWLIRRFIDGRAQFKFVAGNYRPKADELRFDMYRGEYTHVGDRCTFETLLAEFRLADTALQAIAEIVHDLDCKDDKFGRPEAVGVAAVARGIASSTSEDAERVERARLVFDSLYDDLTRNA